MMLNTITSEDTVAPVSFYSSLDLETAVACLVGLAPVYALTIQPFDADTYTFHIIFDSPQHEYAVVVSGSLRRWKSVYTRLAYVTQQRWKGHRQLSWGGSDLHWLEKRLMKNEYTIVAYIVGMMLLIALTMIVVEAVFSMTGVLVLCMLVIAADLVRRYRDMRRAQRIPNVIAEIIAAFELTGMIADTPEALASRLAKHATLPLGLKYAGTPQLSDTTR